MDSLQREMDEAAKKFTAAVKKIEKAIVKYRAGDFEGSPHDAHSQISKALNRLFDQYNKPIVRGNDDFRDAANAMQDRLYAALREAEPHAHEAWQSKMARESIRLRQDQQRAWNDLPEHERERRLHAVGLPYKPR